jgi:hypothetical protein
MGKAHQRLNLRCTSALLVPVRRQCLPSCATVWTHVHDQCCWPRSTALLSQDFEPGPECGTGSAVSAALKSRSQAQSRSVLAVQPAQLATRARYSVTMSSSIASISNLSTNSIWLLHCPDFAPVAAMIEGFRLRIGRFAGAAVKLSETFF